MIKKTLLILAIVVVVFIIVVSVVLGFYLGPIVKIGMEQIGPKVAQVSVNVDTVALSLISGSANIKGLVVGNPKGYSTTQAFSAGTISVSLAPFSVLSNKILVHSIHVESPQITFEEGLGGNNLNKISANVNSSVKSAPSSNTSVQDNGKPAPKIEVDDFLITGAKVEVSINGLIGKEISLPDIHLTDLGKGSDGLTPAELTSAILKAISIDTLTAVTSSVGGIGKTLGSGVSSSVSAITSGLGGLL